MGCVSGKIKKKEKPQELSFKAALLIQQWHRRNLARIEMRRRSTWTIFQSLEYAGEQDQIKLYNFFNALLTHMPKAAASTEGSIASSNDINGTDGANFEIDFPVDKSYSGPKIEVPLTKHHIELLIDLFRKRKNNLLHERYVALILVEASKKLKRLPNLNQTSTAMAKHITIVGDLHGKLDDLLVVFHKNGLPSNENPYIFNGDFVDRGKKGLEVFLLLLVCFVVNPSAVFLNRGNHEDSVMNSRYGFIKEVQSKYPEVGDKLMALIEQVYRWLPLGSIVNNSVLVVHGGISDQTNVDLLKSIDRGKYVSILRPPVEALGAADSTEKKEWKQIFDILWSDPQHTEGCEPNTLRGAGTYFGPDVSEAFLRKYKMKYLIRSHECKPEGHEFMHDNRVITVFSASNYYAIGSNKGSYLKLDAQLHPQFVQYISAASKTMKLTFRQKVGLVESSAIRELGARLRDKRKDLETAFKNNDPKGKGIVSMTKWVEIMEEATKLNLPWRLLRPKLSPPDDHLGANEVNYEYTLELLDTEIIRAEKEHETSVADALYTNKSSLEAIFHILDKDNSGHISLEEFSEACEILVTHLPGANNKEELMDVCRMMDFNNDGYVDLNEFLEAFRLSEMARHGRDSNYMGVERHTTPVEQLAQELERHRVSEVPSDIDPSDSIAKNVPDREKNNHK